jgi:hypothetical protein
MESVMGIMSEVFGNRVVEIDVLVDLKKGGCGFCCGWEYLRLFGAGNLIRIGSGSD